MILLIDNYDSFSYNLVQLIGTIAKEEIKVIRNDEMTVDEVEAMAPEYIILSPGPGRPQDAGICEVYGATITYAKELMHGKQSLMDLDKEEAVFEGLPERIPVARYHSLAADPETMPECLKVIGTTADGEIMAIRHREYEVYGLQFHPESVLTPDGAVILQNFLNK